MLKYFYFLLLAVYSAHFFAQPSLVKGPYLQSATPYSIIIKWETDVPTDTKIMYGTNPASFSYFSGSVSPDVLHEVKINGLNPYTKYYYAVGTTTGIIQGDTNNYFITSPLPGTSGKFRFWITGDCGNNSVNQDSVRNAYLIYNGNRHTDGWLLLGDNAYQNGTDQEYNTNFFAHYQGTIMKKAVLWPAPGNHDYANSLAMQNSHSIAYYSIFSLPIFAEAGGFGSGTEAFYSYDYGNIHFISLDSYGNELNAYRLYDTLGPQVAWLKQDLASNTKEWTVAYWHHPPYTMGSHNSDTESELVTIRENVLRILERYNVDLVLCGHSHSYERSRLMKGHYGSESSFNSSSNNLSSSSALYNGSVNSCPYIKDSLNKGTVYVVSGSAGSLGGQQSSFPHEAMYYSNSTQGGSLILDIDGNRTDAKWLCADGVVRDNFTLFKNVNRVKTYTITAGQTLSLTASWPGTYVWSTPSDTLRTLIVTPSSDTVFWVKDKFLCVADTFHIKSLVGIKEPTKDNFDLKVFPNPCYGLCRIEFYLQKPSVISGEVTDVLGNSYQLQLNGKFEKGKNQFDLNKKELKMHSGIYLLRIKKENEIFTKRVIITE